MGDETGRTSWVCVFTFIAGLLTVGCAVLALGSASDLFLIGVVAFTVLTVVLGIYSWQKISSAAGRLRGKRLSGWGMGMPVCGFGLGFLLLPSI
jgi:hypothetical protein